VWITGATSGIERAATELLAAKGYLVYAGARKDAYMTELNKIKNVTAVRLDVTDQSQIDAAVKKIENQGHGLWGLVNNAGVNVVAPMVIADEAGWTISSAIAELLVYNVGHEHSYTRDEPVQLIDAMWPYATGEKSRDTPEDEAAMRDFMQAWMTRKDQASP
jgi:NAD(P)-dependent dehydrogenase (short-subunit alcohol dehydrogenase family)